MGNDPHPPPSTSLEPGWIGVWFWIEPYVLVAGACVIAFHMPVLAVGLLIHPYMIAQGSYGIFDRYVGWFNYQADMFPLFVLAAVATGTFAKSTRRMAIALAIEVLAYSILAGLFCLARAL